MRLKGGFDPQAPKNQGLACLDGSPNRIENTTVSATFNANVVKIRQELLKILHVDASLSGRYGLYGGGASFSYDNEYSFEEDSLTWAIYADADFGRLEIADPHMKPFAQKLIDQKKWPQFRSACGTEAVTTERRRGSVAAIFSVRNLTERQKEDLQAKANFGASGGVWSVQAQVNYHKFVAQASQLSTIKVTVAVVGGQGIQVLSGLATDYDDLQKVSDIVKQYIAGLTFDNSVASEYYTTDWTAFGYQGTVIDVTRQSDILASLYVTYQDTIRARDRARSILLAVQRPEYQDRLSPAEIATVRKAETDAVNTINTILQRADQCKANASACKPTTDLSPPAVPWPSLQPISRFLVLQSAYRGCAPPPGGATGGCYTYADIDVTYDKNAVQSIEFYGGPDPVSPVNLSSAPSPGRKAVSPTSRWISEIKSPVLLGKHTSVIMLVKDKSGIDEPYSISLIPD